MSKINAPALHAKFAKAKEAVKDYQSAVKAYERARDMDSVVRLYLQHLDMPERGFAIVRKTQSSEGAKLAAKYSEEKSDFRGAIEFKLMANLVEEVCLCA